MNKKGKADAFPFFCPAALRLHGPTKSARTFFRRPGKAKPPPGKQTALTLLPGGAALARAYKIRTHILS